MGWSIGGDELRPMTKPYVRFQLLLDYVSTSQSCQIEESDMRALIFTMLLSLAACEAPPAPPTNNSEKLSQISVTTTQLLESERKLADTIKWVSPAVIGINPAYLEARLGPAREKGDGHLTVDVAGCEVFYTTEGSEIISFYTDVNNECNPVGDATPITSQTRFSDIARAADWGQVFADCLYSCGNAADPSMGLYYRGSRATQFIDVIYSSSYGAMDDAFNIWEQAIRRANGLNEHDSPEDLGIFNCVYDPPPPVVRSMAEVRVQTVIVGRNLRQHCDNG